MYILTSLRVHLYSLAIHHWIVKCSPSWSRNALSWKDTVVNRSDTLQRGKSNYDDRLTAVRHTSDSDVKRILHYSVQPVAGYGGNAQTKIFQNLQADSVLNGPAHNRIKSLRHAQIMGLSRQPVRILFRNPAALGSDSSINVDFMSISSDFAEEFSNDAERKWPERVTLEQRVPINVEPNTKSRKKLEYVINRKLFEIQQLDDDIERTKLQSRALLSVVKAEGHGIADTTRQEFEMWLAKVEEIMEDSVRYRHVKERELEQLMIRLYGGNWVRVVKLYEILQQNEHRSRMLQRKLRKTRNEILRLRQKKQDARGKKNARQKLRIFKKVSDANRVVKKLMKEILQQDQQISKLKGNLLHMQYAKRDPNVQALAALRNKHHWLRTEMETLEAQLQHKNDILVSAQNKVASHKQAINKIKYVNLLRKNQLKATIVKLAKLLMSLKNKESKLNATIKNLNCQLHEEQHKGILASIELEKKMKAERLKNENQIKKLREDIKKHEKYYRRLTNQRKNLNRLFYEPLKSKEKSNKLKISSSRKQNKTNQVKPVKPYTLKKVALTGKKSSSFKKRKPKKLKLGKHGEFTAHKAVMGTKFKKVNKMKQSKISDKSKMNVKQAGLVVESYFGKLQKLLKNREKDSKGFQRAVKALSYALRVLFRHTDSLRNVVNEMMKENNLKTYPGKYEKRISGRIESLKYSKSAVGAVELVSGVLSDVALALVDCIHSLVRLVSRVPPVAILAAQTTAMPPSHTVGLTALISGQSDLRCGPVCGVSSTVIEATRKISGLSVSIFSRINHILAAKNLNFRLSVPPLDADDKLVNLSEQFYRDPNLVSTLAASKLIKIARAVKHASRNLRAEFFRRLSLLNSDVHHTVAGEQAGEQNGITVGAPEAVARSRVDNALISSTRTLVIRVIGIVQRLLPAVSVTTGDSTADEMTQGVAHLQRLLPQLSPSPPFRSHLLKSTNPNATALFVSQVVVRLGHVMRLVSQKFAGLARHRLNAWKYLTSVNASSSSSVDTFRRPDDVVKSEYSNINQRLINSKLIEVLEAMDRWSGLLLRRVNYQSMDSFAEIDQHNLKLIESIKLNLSSSPSRTAAMVAQVLFAIAKRMRNTGNSLLKLMEDQSALKQFSSSSSAAVAASTQLSTFSSLDAKHGLVTPTAAPAAYVSLNVINQHIISVLKSLDKWTRLLYKRTIVSESINSRSLVTDYVNLTSLNGLNESSVQVANVIVKLAKRLRHVVRNISDVLLVTKYATRNDNVQLSAMLVKPPLPPAPNTPTTTTTTTATTTTIASNATTIDSGSIWPMTDDESLSSTTAVDVLTTASPSVVLTTANFLSPSGEERSTIGKVQYNSSIEQLIASELLRHSRLMSEIGWTIYQNVMHVRSNIDNERGLGLQQHQSGSTPALTAQDVWVEYVDSLLRSAVETRPQKQRLMRQLAKLSQTLYVKTLRLYTAVREFVAVGGDTSRLRLYETRSVSRRQSDDDTPISGIGVDNSTSFGCSYRQIDFILPDDVNLVRNGVVDDVAINGTYIVISNLTSVDVQRGNNADLSVEFTFMKPARVVGIAFPHLQTARDVNYENVVSMATVFVEPLGVYGTWSPVVDLLTKDSLLMPISNLTVPFASLRQSKPFISRVRLYPQFWTGNSPTLYIPVFVICRQPSANDDVE